MKKRNVKLLVSGLTLGLAALTTVGSTYAWFTTNGQATISGMDIQAQAAGEGIFVSANGKEYTNDTTTLNAQLAEKFTDVKLQPTTTLNGINFYKLNSSVFDTATGEQDDNGKTTNYFKYDLLSSEKVDSAQYYISFDLYFAVTENTNIQISASFANKENSTDAIKVARFSYGVYTEGSDSAKTVVAPTTANTRAFTEHTEVGTVDYALNSINTLYSKNVKDKSYGIGNTDGGKNSYFNETPTLTDEEVMVDADQTYASFTDNLDDSIKSFDTATFGEGTFRFVKVHFNMWLEGNDKLCSNKVSNEAITGSFTFKAAKKTA